MAKKHAKLIAEKLNISEQKAQGRVVAEILRNSDKGFSTGTGGVHDYEVRSILGCGLLNCNGAKNDPHYADSSYNSQYIAANQDAFDTGLGQLQTGKTYNQLVTDNVKNDPVGAGLAGAGLVGMGYMTGGAGTALGSRWSGRG